MAAPLIGCHLPAPSLACRPSLCIARSLCSCSRRLRPPLSARTPSNAIRARSRPCSQCSGDLMIHAFNTAGRSRCCSPSLSCDSLAYAFEGVATALGRDWWMGECVVTVVLNAMALCHGLHGLRECVRVKLTTMCGKKLFTQQNVHQP